MTSNPLRPACCLIAGALLASCAWVQSLVPPPLPGVPPGAVGVNGEVAYVTGIAMRDLIGKRHEERVAAEQIERCPEADAGMDDAGLSPDAGVLCAPATPAWIVALNECMAEPGTYDTYVAWDGTQFIVRVLPVVERCVRSGGSLHGGGARYTISGTDYSITSRELDE